MIKKESLKDILDHRGGITFPYKEKVTDWYTTIRIAKVSGSLNYIIEHDGRFIKADDGEDGFPEFDDLYEKLKVLLNNAGAIQDQILDENPELDPEADWDKIVDLVNERMKS